MYVAQLLERIRPSKNYLASVTYASVSQKPMSHTSLCMFLSDKASYAILGREGLSLSKFSILIHNEPLQMYVVAILFIYLLILSTFCFQKNYSQ